MSELTIRRERSFVPQYQTVSKAEKPAGSVQGQRVSGTAGFTISGTLQQLMNKATQAESRSRESRRTLQTGEAALDEVQDSLERMAKLAREAASGGKGTDRAALQAELEQLRESVDRVINSASAGNVPLFLDEDAGTAKEPESLLYAASASAKPEDSQAVSNWLIRGMLQSNLSAEEVLAALGLDKTASGSEILAALAEHPLGSGSAVDYLAAIYLGAVISNGAPPDGADLQDALEGLWQLLDQVESGVPLDEAIELLTEGKFTSFADFQAQFTGGTAPGLETFLVDLLLGESGPALSPESSLLSLLAGLKGVNLDMLMGLLDPSQAPQAASETSGLSSSAQPAPESSAQPSSAQPVGNVLVSGQDLSGVSYDAATGVLTVSGTADVTIQGSGQGEQAIVLTGSGQVTLQGVEVSVLTVDGAEVRIFNAEESILNEVSLGEGASLTVDGEGRLSVGVLRGGASSVLRLAGQVMLLLGEDGETETQTLPVLVDGSAALAAQAASMGHMEKSALEPLDLLWKALLPGWNAVAALELDGRQVKMAQMNSELMRLWLAKGDPSHGAPLHSLVLRGRDDSGHPMTRYAYLHWNQETGAFQEISMYPNPFSVTGGEPGQDWVYEEEFQTLHILSSQVTAISGGSGTDAAQAPFSGRIALADGIGPMELSLGGVVCRVSSGRAFSLGQGNDVTLILQSGTSNLFESGTGCAGISLGSGTSLNIDCADPHSGGDPDGVLTATGGAGGAGIGWDSEESWEQPGQILIRGGVSVGAGSLAGSVTIIGGIIVSTDGKGGGETGLTLQVGGDTVALPQFRLSSRILRLDGLSVETREQAHAAALVLETDRRWVSRIQAAYGALYRQMEQSFGGLYSQYIGRSERVVRDSSEASTLLEDMRQSILLQSAQALQTHGRRGTADVEQLLR